MYRPALTALEDRNAPGDILSGVLAAAIGGALLNPMGQVAAWVGDSSAGSRPLQTDRPSIISVGAGTRPLPDNVPFPRIDLARPERDAVAVPVAISTVGVVPTNLDDQFLFAPAAQPTALLRFDATTPVNAVASSGGDGGSSGVHVGSTTPSGSSGGVVSIAGADTSAAFLLRPTARPVPTVPNETGHITVTGSSVDSPTAPTGAVRLGGAPELASNFEHIVDLPPNVAPVANDDTAAVSEDGSVIIDVLGNDTDADYYDTLRIDTWDWQPAHGTVTQEPDGTLKYTPFPDFPASYIDPQAHDTFTYSVTDGRGVSNTATVTVTVTAVNDAPRAFNDAFPFIHVPPGGDPNAPWIVYGAADLDSVLDNDSDIDASSLHVASVVLADGFPGAIDMDPSGHFKWTGPETWYGATSFKYTAADSTESGPALVSNWATVHLWALDYPPSYGELAARDDLFPIGDEAQTFNVTANDTGAAVAVLAGRQSGKQITDFGFDGTVTYAPPSVGDLSLIYRVFSAGGAVSTLATVTLADVDLQIFNGQGAKNSVRRNNDDEKKVGAFTVVNTNDTDGNGTYDHLQTEGG